MKGILNNLHYLVVCEVVYSTMLFSIIAKTTHDFWLKIQESILRVHSTVITSVGRSSKTVKLVVWRFHRKCTTAHVGHLKVQFMIKTMIPDKILGTKYKDQTKLKRDRCYRNFAFGGKTHYRPGQIACPMSIGCARGQKNLWGAPDFSGAHLCLVNKKFSFDLQITSQIDKKMKKSEWILNTIVIISTLVIFCCLNIWWCQSWLIYS